MARSKTPAKKPRRAYHHGNLRRALLDEALATIRDEGVEGVTLREIGAKLGVSRTALYRHFTDKAALLEAVATEGFRTLREQLLAAWDDGHRGLSGFAAMGAGYIRFAVANPSHYRVMFGGSVDPGELGPELAVEAAGAFHALVDALAALQRDGLVRGDHTLTVARFVWAVVHGVSMLAIDGRVRDPAAVDTLARYAIEGVRIAISTGSERPPAPAQARARRRQA